MARTREQMAEYQRQRRQRQRAETDEAPARAKSATRASEVPIAMEEPGRLPRGSNGMFRPPDPGSPVDLQGRHVHEWRRAEDECICDDCGEIVPWKGKLLARYTDGLPEWPQLIQAIPTKEIERILNRVNSKSR